MKRICDIAVIGRDMASLVAAMMCARWGKRTILIAEQGLLSDHELSGYRFFVDPTPLSGFGPSQTCLKLLAELDLPLPERSRLERLDPAMQVILPGCRLDLPADREALCEELQREFPLLANEFRPFFSSMQDAVDLFNDWTRSNPLIRPSSLREGLKLLKLTPKLLKTRFALIKMMRRAERKAPSMKRVLEAERFIFSDMHDASLTSLSSAYAFCMPWRGLYYAAGGRGSLLESMQKAFQDMGGEIVSDCSVVRIRTLDENEIDLKAGDDVEKILADRLIVSTKWENLAMILLSERRFQRLGRRLRNARTVRFPFTIQMGVREACLPEKLAPLVAFVNDEKKSVMDQNLIFLQVSRPGDLELAPPGKRAMNVTFFLQESPLRLTNEELQRQILSELDRLDSFLPFLRENIDYLDVEKSIELARRHQEVINSKYSTKPKPFLGIMALTNRTPSPRVFLTGGLLLAGLGYEGEIMAGVHSAHAALADQGGAHDAARAV